MLFDCALVFASSVLLDLFYALWVTALAKGKPFLAGISSVFIGLSGVIGLGGVLTNHWLIIPYCVGLFSGTVAGYWLGKRR